jgi:hypothetical protein
LHQRANCLHFVAVDRVSHSSVNAFVDDASHSTQCLSRFVHALERDVRIDVAATEEDGRSAHRPHVVANEPRWADQPAADTPLVGETQHVFRRAASAVKEDTGHARMSQWRATLHYALPRVRIAGGRLISRPQI